MVVNYWTLIGAIAPLAISLVSAYRPSLVWGKLRSATDEASRKKFIRWRRIGTLAYFSVGAILLVLSFHR